MIAKGSFEDFFYIFIGLIWIGFSIYKAQQKKKAVSQSRGNVKKEKSFLENLMSEFINEESPNPYINSDSQPQQATSSESKVKKPKVFSYDDMYEESNAVPEFNVYEKKQSFQEEIKKQDKTSQQSQKIKPRINLRKAVIYSEILNRKYT